MRTYVSQNPSRSELDAHVFTALQDMKAVRYAYVIRNHLDLDRICLVRTKDVYASLRRLEKQGVVTCTDTGRGNGSPYRYRWGLKQEVLAKTGGES
ncbi:hypothetical protein [Ochrobactrum chromiisoli]|uniref:Transcription regulator TrmB N-terminal domain-containing protein n=1 Tax=Ochrobactrum chromiisoli TaxID=2993941 RepID=A0ABT3QQH3_9HYPH|nr:hypothetical protein [Ochrobactrum chromiisoli]MCX2697856.1 hypothetical protein [Ochrobactrum chromiisoli]